MSLMRTPLLPLASPREAAWSTSIPCRGGLYSAQHRSTMGALRQPRLSRLERHHACCLVALSSFHHVHFDGRAFGQSFEGSCHHDLTCKMDILICPNINEAIPLVRDQLYDFPGQPWPELGGF